MNNQEDWNIFDLPQETKNSDWKVLSLLAVVIAILAFVIIN